MCFKGFCIPTIVAEPFAAVGQSLRFSIFVHKLALFFMSLTIVKYISITLNNYLDNLVHHVQSCVYVSNFIQ